MSESSYLVFKTESSFCPECNENAYLLTSVDKGKSSFYICFKCTFIGEVGVGRVKVEKE